MTEIIRLTDGLEAWEVACSDRAYWTTRYDEGDTPMIDAYTDHDEYEDDYDEYEDDYADDAREWRPGECDNCYGGDENGITATGPLGPLYCACFIGQGASEEDCRCGPPDDDAEMDASVSEVIVAVDAANAWSAGTDVTQ